MLNCKQVRQIKLADPKRATIWMRLHMRFCPKCACFSNDVDALEKDLGDALRIDVPESLVERIVPACRSASARAAAIETPSLHARAAATLRRIFGSRRD